jgi:hypothetical protein
MNAIDANIIRGILGSGAASCLRIFILVCIQTQSRK